MKRFYLCIAIAAALVALCFVSLFNVKRINKRVFELTSAVSEQIVSQDYSAARETLKSLKQYWQDEEKFLLRFVRHSDIDIITTSVAKLEAFLTYENLSDLMAEIEQIEITAKRIYDFEIPTLTNIL